MKTTIVKCNCDYCGQEMEQFEYEQALQVTMRVDLPNPKGGCGQVSGIEIKLCNKCSEMIGIVNLEEYHKYIDSQTRLKNAIKKYKKRILELIFNKSDSA